MKVKKRKYCIVKETYNRFPNLNLEMCDQRKSLTMGLGLLSRMLRHFFKPFHGFCDPGGCRFDPLSRHNLHRLRK